MAYGKCVLKYRRVSPKKAQLVARLIRNKPVPEAMALLKFSPQRSAEFFRKALAAAIASYRQGTDEPVDLEYLVVTTATVDQGPGWKIIKPAIKPMRFGGYSFIRRRTSHITVEVSDMLEEAMEEEE